MLRLIGSIVLLGAIAVLIAIWQAQLLTWALPYFRIRGIGLDGPFLLAVFLDSVIGGAVGFAGRRH